ncbi:MAG: hypothetical protein JNK49_00625 [Planctomycetes bacterium]|nr:hypothetical protein [Planctomycetota bacterium]
MFGGLALHRNLLAATGPLCHGEVHLFDLAARRRVAAFALPPGDHGVADAAGIAFGAHGELLVADPQNHRVCRTSVFGRLAASHGEAPPARGDRGRDRPGVLEFPVAVAVDPIHHTWFVAGGELPRRCAVQCATPEGAGLRVVPSLGQPGAEYGAPRGLWCDRHGLLVADTLHRRLQRFRLDGTFVATVPCRGQPVAVASALGHCFYLTSAPRAELHGVHLDGAPLPVPAACRAALDQPIALTADAAGSLYVLDRCGERVLRLQPDLGTAEVLFDVHAAEARWGPR